MTELQQQKLNENIMPKTLLEKFINVLKKQKEINETIQLLKLLASDYGFRFYERGNNNYLSSYNCKPLINFYIDDDQVIKYSLLDEILI